MVPPAEPHVHHPVVWLDRPRELEPLDEDSATALLAQPALPASTFPPAPHVPVATRPLVGGDALALADVALHRGDAFDALAQYRALVGNIDPAAASYLKLQIARSYVALSDPERAVPLLEMLAADTGDIGRVALFELSDVLASQHGVVEALRDIKPLAGPRYEDIVDHVINTCSDDEAVELLMDKAERLNTCEYAVAAVAIRPLISAKDVLAACRWDVEVVQTAPAVRERYRRLVDFRVRLNPFVERWEQLADAYRAGNHDPAPWIALSDDVIALRPFARESESFARLSVIAATALVIASELSISKPPHDPQLLLEIRERAAALDYWGADDVRRHVGMLLHYYLPRQYPDK
jgi:hypothetical protein